MPEPGLTEWSAVAGGPVLNFAGSVAVGGVTGAISSGGDMHAAMMSAMTAGMFNFVGTAFPMSQTYWGNVAAHAAVGCVSSMMGGGKCGPGAASAAFSDMATPYASGYGQVGGTVVSAVVGGTTSALGGGKFGNGAMT